MQSIKRLIVLAISLTVIQTAIADESFNWAGAYAGFSVGARFEDADWTTTSYQDPVGGVLALVGNPNASLDSTDLSFNGFAGYNWIRNPRVILGIDANIGYADNEDKQITIPGVRFDSPPDFTFATTETTWIGSLRGRLGYLVTPRYLLYGLAGLAVAEVELEAVCPADTDFCDPSAGTQSNSESETMIGWTLGAGFEAALTDKLLARIEYNYADYGTFDFDGLPVVFDESFGFTSDVDYTSHTISLGIAYKF